MEQSDEKCQLELSVILDIDDSTGSNDVNIQNLDASNDRKLALNSDEPSIIRATSVQLLQLWFEPYNNDDKHENNDLSLQRPIYNTTSRAVAASKHEPNNKITKESLPTVNKKTITTSRNSLVMLIIPSIPENWYNKNNYSLYSRQQDTSGATQPSMPRGMKKTSCQEDTDRNNSNILVDIHPALVPYFCVVGLIISKNEKNSNDNDDSSSNKLEENLNDSENQKYILLLKMKEKNYKYDNENPVSILRKLDGKSMEYCAANCAAFIKLIALSKVNFFSELPTKEIIYESKKIDCGTDSNENIVNSKEKTRISFEIPCCNICLHRIRPQHLGILPERDVNSNSSVSEPQKPKASTSKMTTNINPCSISWSHSTDCNSCQIIHKQTAPSVKEMRLLECFQCGMKETLWICLTCGIVGCGRYSRGHAGDHFKEYGHPYSLELVTGRIWDYVTGMFVHRADSEFHVPFDHTTDNSLPDSANANEYPLKTNQNFNNQAESSLANSLSAENTRSNDCNLSFLNDDDTWNQDGLSFNLEDGCFQFPSYPYLQKMEEEDPKKSIMITEEYEALLQSALEDQAQHYEREIAHLIAEMTEQQVDNSKSSDLEKRTVESLKKDIQQVRLEIDQFSAKLLDKQTEEVEFRAKNEVLLRESTVAKNCLEKIHEDMRGEHEKGKQQVEELEHQFSDLSANLKFMQQIRQDEELSNAQIFGTSGTNKKTRKGRKHGRGSSRR